MSNKPVKDFANRLIHAMKLAGHTASRSPNGICMKTLANFAGSSEQICRRYIRGEALPDINKVIKIASNLNQSPGWLLFGDLNEANTTKQSILIDEDLLHYILDRSYHLYRQELGDTNDYPDFVLELIRDVQQIDTDAKNSHKIVDIAIGSISSYEQRKNKRA